MLIGKNPLKEQPDWFKKNIEIIPLSYSVEVDDKNINYCLCEIFFTHQLKYSDIDFSFKIFEKTRMN